MALFFEKNESRVYQFANERNSSLSYTPSSSLFHYHYEIIVVMSKRTYYNCFLSPPSSGIHAPDLIFQSGQQI